MPCSSASPPDFTIELYFQSLCKTHEMGAKLVRSYLKGIQAVPTTVCLCPKFFHADFLMQLCCFVTSFVIGGRYFHVICDVIAGPWAKKF